MSSKSINDLVKSAKVTVGQLYTLGELERLGLVALGRGKVISKIDLANAPGNNPVYSSSAMGNGEIGRYGKYMFEDERITWSVDGGGRLFYREPHKYSVTNVCGWLKVNTPGIDTKFLYLLLTSRWGRMTFDYTYKAHPSVIREAYRDLSFPILSEQHRLTAKIDQITALIKARELQLSKLDQLVKSRFVEMFGKEMFPLVAMEDVCKVITDGTHQPPVFTAKGIPFLLVSNIRADEIDYATQKFISESDYNILNKRTPIEVGDVLLSTVGSYGHPAIVKENKPFSFQRHIAYLKPDQGLVDSVYLHSAILSESVKGQIEKKVKGIAQKTLNLSEIRKLQLPLPPIGEQRKFAAFVAEVDKSEFAVRKSLEELQKLYRQQLQEAFG